MPILQYTQECLDAAQGLWPASGGEPPGVAAGEPRPPRPKAIRVFKNGFIETVFAKSHPVLPIVWFGPIIAYAIYASIGDRGVGASVGLFLAGALVWTLLEYFLHRVIFHMSATTPAARFRAFMAHGYHHDFPNDKFRLVAPPLLSWPLAVIVSGLYYLGFGPAWLILFAGTATGYIAYDWIHYYTHHFRPRNPVGKWLKRYHLLHHFDDHHGTVRYGVSSPLWDLVFGTYRPLGARATPAQSATDAPTT